jgi:23S rRNA U2552 (ribose-2'-O)-methylase RlmE/FtsJ
MTIPMNKELKDIYKTHAGKISDKWQIYLEEYEEKFKKYRNGPIGLLEIGIQNGGSLEIYSEYFPNAEKIIGCDIHPNCHLLKYNSKVVSVIVGDANSQNVMQMIQSYGEFDIIIDDGSHTSSDIVNSFCNYFGSLRQGGCMSLKIYIAATGRVLMVGYFTRCPQ